MDRLKLQKQTRSQLPKKRIRPNFHQPRCLPPGFNITLPDDVVDNIFTFLPIKKAIQIGVMAPKYKNCWHFCRKLDFDHHFSQRLDYVKAIERVFNSHRGPIIRSFHLSFDPTGFENMVEKWVLTCVEKKVEELDFDFLRADEPYKVSPEFIDIETIKFLRLKYCKVDLPPTLKGMKLLNTLILKRISNITTEIVETVIENCMLLGYLDINLCDGIAKLNIPAQKLKQFDVLRIGNCLDVTHLDINAPTLRTFHYSGPMVDIRFWVDSQLRDVLLNLFAWKRFAPFFQLEALLHYFVRVVVFTTTGPFLEGLCAKSIKEGRTDTFKELRLTFSQLREFQVFMEGATFCNVYDIASFLSICPIIERLFIDLNDYTFECGYFWEAHHRQLLEEFDQRFTELHFIKITGFKFHQNELDLVKFLLKKAPQLENLVVVAAKSNRVRVYDTDIEVYDSLFCCWRVSSETKITIDQHFHEKSTPSAIQRRTWFY